MDSISLTDTAKLIRTTLKTAFPKTKFSVTSKSYSGGCSIDARWTDGPTQGQVQSILDRFQGRGFDGMTDCSYSCGERLYKGQKVDFCGAYIRGSRSVSKAVIAVIADRISYDCGVPTPTIDERGNLQGYHNDRVPFQWHGSWLRDGTSYLTMADIESPKHLLAHDSHEGEYLTRLIDRIAYYVSLEEQRPVDLPEYIDEKATVETGRASFEEKMQMFPHLVN